MQDYKSPCAAVMISAILAKPDTDTRTQHFDWLM